MNSTMRKFPLSWLVLSDIHLGHRKTPTAHIVPRLNTVLETDEAKTADIIAIPGDIFDRQLNLTFHQLTDIHLWIMKLLVHCKRYNVTLLIVEGTPSHDWKQSNLFNIIIEQYGFNIDFHYVQHLDIVHLDRFDIDVMFVPDKWAPTSESTYQQALDKMREKGLSQVDYILFHGAFDYQFPGMEDVPTHKADLWSPLASQYIFSGHIHTHSQYKNIIVPGSFDRLIHGEEGPKGYIHLVARSENIADIRFIENKDATIYKTFDCRGKDVLEAIPQFLSEQDYPQESHFRLILDKDSPFRTNLAKIERRWPDAYWSIKKEKADGQLSNQLTIVKEEYHALDITPENIVRLIQEELTGFTSLTDDDRENALRYLTQFLT